MAHGSGRDTDGGVEQQFAELVDQLGELLVAGDVSAVNQFLDRQVRYRDRLQAIRPMLEALAMSSSRD